MQPDAPGPFLQRRLSALFRLQARRNVRAGLVFALVIAASNIVHANEAMLKWQPSGIASHFSMNAPQRLILKSARPSGLKKSPPDVAAPSYAEFEVGPKDRPLKRIVLLDEPANGTPRLFIDGNGNGDLTDDPPIGWTERQMASGGMPVVIRMGDAQVKIPFGNDTVDGKLVFYRFNKNDPLRAAVADSIFYYRDFGLRGALSLAGKSYPALLVDDLSAGDFRGQTNPQFSGVRLLIDVNSDTRFDERREAYDSRKPFNIGGITWELSGMTADGKFSIVKSSQTVDEIKPLPNLAPGAKVLPFTAKTTTGKTVKFPADYKSKVVLLDFWATWCGPCLAELPNVLSNYSKYKSKGFDILGVSLDQDPNSLAGFTKEKGMTWPQICDGKVWQSELVQLYGVEGIPFMLIVDGNTGEILAGAEARGEALGLALERALAGKKNPN